MSTDGGGLRKRRVERTSVDRTAIRDTRLSFRALGVLLWLLDRPEGWSVRADQMAKDGKRANGLGMGGEVHNREGREAIRTALHELGAAGYYRLERRRMSNGEVRMGTAISEDAVPMWAEQDRYFHGDAVPVVEQPDGSFLVLYPDGSLLPDDFGPPPDREDSSAAPAPVVADPPTPESDDRGPETRFRANRASPGPRNPAPGEPAPGNPSPLEVQRAVRENPSKDGGHAAPQTPLRPQVPPTSALGNDLPQKTSYVEPELHGDLDDDHRPRRRAELAEERVVDDDFDEVLEGWGPTKPGTERGRVVSQRVEAPERSVGSPGRQRAS